MRKIAVYPPWIVFYTKMNLFPTWLKNLYWQLVPLLKIFHDKTIRYRLFMSKIKWSYFWETITIMLLRSCYRSMYYISQGHWKAFFVVYIWQDESKFFLLHYNNHVNNNLQLQSQNKWAPCTHLNHVIYLVWVLNRVLYHKHSSFTKLCRQSLNSVICM